MRRAEPLSEAGVLAARERPGCHRCDGNRILVTLVDGTGDMVYYSYDVRNRLKKVVGGRDEVLADYDYDGAGQIKSFCYGNGVQTKYSYRDDGELSSLVTLTEQGQVLLNFDYAYDGNGNCIRKSGEQYQNEYAYDRMNRLVAAVQGTETYHYNAKNQLAYISNGESTLRYLYDKQGNLLEEQGKANRKQYSYDTANRQVSIVSAEADGTWVSGPDAPHVGWQYGTKGKVVGHIILDFVPTGRDFSYSDLLEEIFKKMRLTWPKNF